MTSRKKIDLKVDTSHCPAMQSAYRLNKLEREPSGVLMNETQNFFFLKKDLTKIILLHCVLLFYICISGFNLIISNTSLVFERWRRNAKLQYRIFLVFFFWLKNKKLIYIFFYFVFTAGKH